MALSITKELESTLRMAIAEAKARRHEHVTLEHLLYALLRDPVAARLLKICGVRPAELRRELEQHMDETLDSLPEGVEREPEQTVAFQRVLQRAAMQVQSSGKEQIDGGNVLIAIFRTRSSRSMKRRRTRRRATTTMSRSAPTRWATTRTARSPTIRSRPTRST